jgi:hypothetical protein
LFLVPAGICHRFFLMLVTFGAAWAPCGREKRGTKRLQARVSRYFVRPNANKHNIFIG